VSDYKDLGKLGIQIFKETLMEIRHGIMIRIGVCRKMTKGHRVIGGSLRFTAGGFPCSITTKEKCQKYSGRIGIRALFSIRVLQSSRVKLGDNFHYKTN